MYLKYENWNECDVCGMKASETVVIHACKPLHDDIEITFRLCESCTMDELLEETERCRKEDAEDGWEWDIEDWKNIECYFD